MKHRNPEMKIAILNQKGGSGKTTVAIHLAHGLSLNNYSVLLVDSDPQGSCRDWAAARDNEAPFTIIGLDRPILHEQIPKLAVNYDFVIIDGAPRVSSLTRSAIMASDLVIIPIQPSPLDIWAAHEVIELIKEASIYKPNLTAAFVVNRKIGNTTIGREVKEVLKEYEIPILESTINQRVSFAEALNSGNTVLETAPQTLAAKEIHSLTSEIIAALTPETEYVTA